MVCADVMTANPSCCEPNDSAVRAARIMRDEDVGSLPVVNNHSEKRLVGIVTDRDLAIQVIAQGQDSNSARVNEIMTPQPVSCHVHDDAAGAMEAMSQHQVRRIPVIDDDNRVVGIIAQADVALCADERGVGKMVEDISQEGNAVGRAFSRVTHPSEWRGGSNAGGMLAAIGVGAALGATVMCLFDPARGQARREKVSSTAKNIYGRSADLVTRSGQSARKTRMASERYSGTPETLGV